MRSNKMLFYHYAEWIMNHPRFGFLMIALILLSFTHNSWLAGALFIVFAIEISFRIMLIRHKVKTNPYKTSINRKIDGLFLFLDIVGVLSLLVTIFDSAIPADDATIARLVRALYLLRALRLFRYIDLQSAIYSPTYGMVISLLVLLSFFASGALMWIILIFFLAELMVRFVIMRNMEFPSRKEKSIEWFFWSVDLIATIAMLPGLSTATFGGVLRMLRLVRLLRPWLVIFKNLGVVIREGQYLQEINLIVLLLAVLSIAGGVGGHLFNSGFDYTHDGIINDDDETMLAKIWFAFRAFTDPGNVVFYPESNGVAIFSVFAVITGVFIFSFFIGIGANIVSGLMSRLRNEKLNIANHMVMLGWNSVAPFIIEQLNILSHRTFARLKLVLLNDKEERPRGFHSESWVTYRWGDVEDLEALERINLATARQVIVNVPKYNSDSLDLAHSFFSLMAIRKINPNIYINYATPGLSTPRLKSYHHRLQVGWDTENFYNKPTVILSEADVRANLFKQIFQYADFDQVIGRLMIPERHEESALHVVEWPGTITQDESGDYWIENSSGTHKMKLSSLVKAAFERGVIVLAFSDSNLRIYPAMCPGEEFEIFTVIGISLDNNSLFGEIEYVIRHQDEFLNERNFDQQTNLIPLHEQKSMKVVIVGWLGSLPLIMKRMLQDVDYIKLVIFDDLNRDEHIDQILYLNRRLSEMKGAKERIDIEMIRWKFSDMEKLREHAKDADKIVLSRPIHIQNRPHALIASVLSHLITILNEEERSPEIFPVVDTRDQARMLQEELERFNHNHEIHVVVPNEFYGSYVAHTSFHMFTSTNETVYNMHRTLRYVIDDLMADIEEGVDLFDIESLKVQGPLPEDPRELFHHLYSRGYLWIGFRTESISSWEDKVYKRIFQMFPRTHDFRCLRQKQIAINPYGTPFGLQTWRNIHTEIEELIAIRVNNISVREGNRR